MAASRRGGAGKEKAAPKKEAPKAAAVVEKTEAAATTEAPKAADAVAEAKAAVADAATKPAPTPPAGAQKDERVTVMYTQSFVARFGPIRVKGIPGVIAKLDKATAESLVSIGKAEYPKKKKKK